MDREQALRYVELRRNSAPGLYNQRRLSEQPISTTTQNVRANVQHTIRRTGLISYSNQSQNSSILASAGGFRGQNGSANVNKENVSPNVGLVTDEAGPSNQVEFVDVDASPSASLDEFSNEVNPILITATTHEESSNGIHTELLAELPSN